MPRVRPYTPADEAAVVEMCLRTNRDQFTDHDLLPDVLVRPYLTAEPEIARVAVDDGDRVVGYILGTADTEAHVTWLTGVWLPVVGPRHPLPPRLWHPVPVRRRPPRDVQEFWTLLLHTPAEWLIRPQLRTYPGHLHIDLLPEHQGQGLGRRLMTEFLAALRARGCPAVHLSYLRTNTGAGAFYERMGFRPVEVPDAPSVHCVGRSTAD